MFDSVVVLMLGYAGEVGGEFRYLTDYFLHFLYFKYHYRSFIN